MSQLAISTPIISANFLQALLKDTRDPLSEWLDQCKGYTVSEHSIFSKLSQRWETEFHKDMDGLNVGILWHPKFGFVE